jgi:hypothetical protein
MLAQVFVPTTQVFNQVPSNTVGVHSSTMLCQLAAGQQATLSYGMLPVTAANKQHDCIELRVVNLHVTASFALAGFGLVAKPVCNEHNRSHCLNNISYEGCLSDRLLATVKCDTITLQCAADHSVSVSHISAVPLR